MTQHQPKRLADLKPGAVIKCFYCGLDKPEAGAVRFRAWLVCAGCAWKLNNLKMKDEK